MGRLSDSISTKRTLSEVQTLVSSVLQAAGRGEPHDWLAFYVTVSRKLKALNEAVEANYFVPDRAKVRKVALLVDDLDRLLPVRTRHVAAMRGIDHDPDVLAAMLEEEGELVPHKAIYSKASGRVVGMIFVQRGQYHFRLMRPFVELRGPYPDESAVRFNVEAIMGGNCAWEPHYD